MAKTIELTLCADCAQVFYFDKTRKIKRKDYRQKIKEPCDICKRKGYDFVIKEVKQR